MKSVAFIFSLVFVYGVSFAQGNNHEPSASATSQIDTEKVQQEQPVKLGDLKGPRAKNYPTHAYQASRVVVAVPAEGSEKRMGPAAKNYRPWQDDTETQRVTITKKERRNLKGPRFKNRKPWDNR